MFNRRQPRSKLAFESVYDTLIEDIVSDTKRSAFQRHFGLGVQIPLPITDDVRERTKTSRHSYELDESQPPLDETAMLLDPGIISRALGISAGLPIEDVAALRRAFSAHNHPDLAPAHLQSIATQRMMLANRLFDAYRKSKKS